MSNTTRRNRLLASCAAAAIATLTLHAPVRAQGFKGAPITAPTGATVTTPNGTTTTVIIEAPKAIVNWQADNNDFLPVGNTANFVNSEARVGQDYTILNRIKPATNDQMGRVALNGTISSTLGLNTANGASGGNIWFYSPNGLLVGSGAQINVGSLLLSSLDVADAQFMAGGTIRFGEANVLDVPFNPNASMEVQGTISALGQNAYVALIAPRVYQSGAITVAGSAHYVAAEAVDMTINGSLFDIAVQVGSSVGGSRKGDAALVHDGTTNLQGEENGYGAQPAPGRSAVFVAVPKNDAVTMLVQGAIDYAPATGATVEGNRIVLSAGRNVTAGAIDATSRPGNPAGVANIRIDNNQVDNDVFRSTRFGGDVVADATGAITVAARDTIPESGYGPFPPDIDFARSVSLKAERGVAMNAEAKGDADAEGGFLRVGGDLLLDASSTTGAGTGDVRLSSQAGGRIDVLGSATLRADTSSEGFAPGNGVTVTSTRVVEIAGEGGAIRIDGSATLSADANGGSGNDDGGSATGGTARIVNSGAGDVVILGSAQIEADGRGGRGGSDGVGGSGSGGTAKIETSAGRIDIRGSFVELQANGSSESGYGPGAGAGVGGTVALIASAGGAISLNIGADFGGNFIRAEGEGGSANGNGAGGTARGGTAIVSATGGGRITSEFGLDVNADAFGGGSFSTGGIGGDAQGGTATITADDGTINIEGEFFVSADAEGGTGRAAGGNAIAGGGARGDGTFVPGGVSLLLANGARIDAGDLTLRATATGGQGLDGGDGTGGRITSVIGGDAFLNVIGDFEMFADGIGGRSDDFGYGDGSFGTGRGGAITLDVDGDGETFGELRVSGLTLLSAAGNPFRFSDVDRLTRQAAPSANGGDGFGGSAAVTVNGDLSTDTLRLDVTGRGNAGIDSTRTTDATAAPGSTGQGGTATVTIGEDAGTVDMRTLTIAADGVGGEGGEAANPGAGGVGQGGTAALVILGGEETVIDFAQLSATGQGGRGGEALFSADGVGGTGGAGIGGTVAITVADAEPFVGSLQVALQGNGGSGGDGDGDGDGGTGGLGEGGTLSLSISDGGALTIPVQTYSASGFGGEGGQGGTEGGAGGDGGAGQGGTIDIGVTGGTLSAPSDVGYGTIFSARGEGGSGGRGATGFGGEGGTILAGDGGQGGSGQGGEITFTGINANLNFGGLQLESSGQGGFGGGGGNGFGGVAGGNGGRGGIATGGTAELDLADDGSGSLSLGSGGISVSARASGGRGGEGGYGATGGVSGDGGAAQGGTVLIGFDGEFALSSGIGGDASAIGGDGGDAFDTGYGEQSAAGGAGGNGTGGTVTLEVTGGDVRLAPFTQLSSFGDGGSGAGSASLAGGAGGKGSGGILNVTVTGGELSAPALSLRADGSGASGGGGGDDVVGGNGGRGGDAQGGEINLATAGTGRLVTNFNDGRGLEAHADARAGTGGSGGDGSQVGDTGGVGGNAGDAQGGDVAFAVNGGEMDLGDIKVTANGWGGSFSSGGIGAGQEGVIDNPGTPEDETVDAIPETFAPGGSDGRGAGGTIGFRVADAANGDAGRLTAGAVSLRATGRFGGGDNDAAGLISLVRTAAAPDSRFQIASLEARALGVNGEAPNGFELSSSAGAIEVLNNAAIEVDRDAALRASGSGTLTVGGELNLLVGGNLDLTQALGATQPLAGADLIRINAGSVTGASAALTAVRDIRVVSPGSVSFGVLDAGDDILIDAFSASIGRAVTRGPDEPGEEENDGSDIVVNTVGDIEFLIGATAADDIRLTSSAGNVRNTGAQATGLDAVNEVSVVAEGEIVLASASAGGRIGLRSVTGDVRLDNGSTPDVIEIDADNGSFLSAGLLQANSLDVNVGNDIAINDVEVTRDLRLFAFGGAISGGRFQSDRNIDLFASNGVAVAALDAFNFIGVNGGSGPISIGSATTSALGGEGGDGIFLRTNGLVTLDQADSAGVIDVEGFGFGGGDLRADRSIRIFITEQDRGEEALLARVAALGDIAFDSADAGTFVSLSAPGAISAGTIVAGENIVAEGGSIAVTGAATAGRDVLLEAAGDILLAAATAGDDVEATSFDGAIDAGRVVTTGLGEDLGEETGYGPGPGDGSNIRLAAQGDVRLDDGDAVNLIELTATAGQVFSASLLKASDLLVASAGDIALADADIRNDIALDAGVGAISGADFTSGGAITLTASESVTLASATAGDDITILAGTTASVAAVTTTGLGTDSDGDGFGISIEAAGDVGFGAADAVGDLRLVSREGGIVRLDGSGASLIDAGGSLFVSAADDLNLSSVLAGRDITLISGGAIDTGNLTAPGALSLTAGAGLSADVVRAGSLLADAASIDFADVELAGVLNLATPGALVLGRAKASDIVGAASRVRAGTLEAAGNIVLSAAMDGVEVGAALAGSDIALSGRIVSLSDGTAGRDIRVDASGDATIGSARAGDDFTANVGGAFTGTTVITTGQGPDGEDNGYGTLAAVANDGSNIRVTSVGAIALETGTAADAIALASSNGAISSTKALTAGTGLLVSAAGAMSLADATAGDGIDLVAGTGIGAANLIGGTDVRLQAKGGDVMLTTARAGDDIDVTATGATTIARATTTGSAPDDGNNGSSVLVTSPGGVSIARIESTGGAVLRAANGAVTVSDDLRSVRPVEASGRAVSLRSLGALGVRSAVATAGNVALTSAGNLSLESADASGTVAAASAATLGITGTVGGAQIALSSRDIAIGSAAQIGSAQRTGTIQVTANGTSATAPAVVGGSGQGSNYRLDNAEFGRLAAQNVAVSVQGETAALQVDTLTVRQPSVTRSLTLSSSGDVAMIGRLTYENAGADNVVRVNAARAFTANAPGAGIVVANAQGALTGSIDVDARSIVVASAQAQADLATTGNIAARDDRLGRNDGETDNAGFLRAGAIRLAASERIFVQNSGLTSDENDDRAGLSAGVGGITLVTKGTSPVEIVINGRQDDGAGGVIVGAALIEELTITGQEGGPGSFAPGSTVNGCLIGGSNCLGLPLDFGVSVEPLLSELTEEEDEDEEDGAFAGPPSVGFSQLITTDGSPLLPVIDDPVTGAGNDDLIIGTGPLVDIDNSQRDRDEQVNMPVTGTGNGALQGGTAPPAPAGSTPDGQPTIDDPVTGAGNDDLQDGPNR